MGTLCVQFKPVRQSLRCYGREADAGVHVDERRHETAMFMTGWGEGRGIVLLAAIPAKYLYFATSGF
jgi:hypothetical protein